jgi:serine/threonine-protein kinase
MEPAPRLIQAMAQYRIGQKEAARKTLAAAVLGFDWRAAEADSHDPWICHALRREAEALILPNLSGCAQADHRPQDNVERVVMLGACQFQGRYRAVARLYADIFRADPALADNLGAGHRYSAARFATLAAAGRGKDAQKLTDRERARLRQQALGWLHADLAASARTTDRAVLSKTLRRWQQDPDLASVREPEALAALPEAERQGWRKLWSAVAERLQETAARR